MKQWKLLVSASVMGITPLIAPVSEGWQDVDNVNWQVTLSSLSEEHEEDPGHQETSTSVDPYDEWLSPDVSSPDANWRSTYMMLAQVADSLGGVKEIAEKRLEEGSGDGDSDISLDQIAEMMANPFSYLWFGVVQNDTYWWDGDLLDELDEDGKVMNTTLIQPVMSLQLTEESRLIFRPTIPINSFNTLDGFDLIDDEEEGPILTSDWNRETGLGDIVLWTAYSPQYTPPFVYGFGPTIMMDTASEEWLGTGKWSAGPMATVINITDKWIMGGVIQHWWSFAGDDDRDDVNLTDFQPIIRYRVSAKTNIGIAPNIRYNWDGDSGNKLQLPLGGGFSTVVQVGRLPLAVGAEFYYYVKTNDDFGPEYQFRFFLTPVLPAPDWSRDPLFGN